MGKEKFHQYLIKTTKLNNRNIIIYILGENHLTIICLIRRHENPFNGFNLNNNHQSINNIESYIRNILCLLMQILVKFHACQRSNGGIKQLLTIMI